VTRPAKGVMTVRDLMRHTSGLTYGFFGAGPAREAYNAAAHSGEQGTPLDCHHVNACAAAMLPQADGPMLGLRAIRDDYPLPGSEIGAAIALSCDLPPPRA